MEQIDSHFEKFRGKEYLLLNRKLNVSLLLNEQFINQSGWVVASAERLHDAEKPEKILNFRLVQERLSLVAPMHPTYRRSD